MNAPQGKALVLAALFCEAFAEDKTNATEDLLRVREHVWLPEVGPLKIKGMLLIRIGRNGTGPFELRVRLVSVHAKEPEIPIMRERVEFTGQAFSAEFRPPVSVTVNAPGLRLFEVSADDEILTISPLFVQAHEPGSRRAVRTQPGAH